MKTDKYSCSLGAYTLMGDIQSTDINVTTWAIRKTPPPPPNLQLRGLATYCHLLPFFLLPHNKSDAQIPGQQKAINMAE